MNREEIKPLMEAVADVVREYVDGRLAALPAPKDGAPGRDGKDADDAIIFKSLVDEFTEAMPALVKRHVETVVAALPVPKDGAPGERGADGAPGLGLRGERGEPGPPGQDGRDGVDCGKETAADLAKEFIEGLMGAGETEAEGELLASLALTAAAKMYEESRTRASEGALRIDRLQRTSEMTVGALRGVIEGQGEIIETLRARVVPEYDGEGRLVGARRVMAKE